MWKSTNPLGHWQSNAWLPRTENNDDVIDHLDKLHANLFMKSGGFFTFRFIETKLLTYLQHFRRRVVNFSHAGLCIGAVSITRQNLQKIFKVRFFKLSCHVKAVSCMKDIERSTVESCEIIIRFFLYYLSTQKTRKIRYDCIVI